jgi:regulator of cell morphogenesis and NO signaling
MISFTQKTIKQIVSDNPAIAAALRFLGIHFNDYNEHTLLEICNQKSWKLEMILMKIENLLKSPSDNKIKFDELPIDLMVEYLKHNHYVFIKEKLPFITELVQNFDGNHLEIKRELQFVIPLFIEDFIEHIYEEEDTLFGYILLLDKAIKDPSLLHKAQSRMMENSIKLFQNDHEVHEDQLRGLRRMTNNFEICQDYDLSTRIVISELNKLDSELKFHAKIENDILFPKALVLERHVLALIRSKIALN